MLGQIKTGLCSYTRTTGTQNGAERIPEAELLIGNAQMYFPLAE